MRRLAAAALVLATPLLLAATPDRTGDVTSCSDGGPVRDRSADVVSVDGLAEELDTSAAWRITFASPLAVPDPDGAPLRIDVLVRDPELPPATVGDERGMNRIVRWDATAPERPVDIVWLGGQGHTPFNPPEISGRTVEIRVPGRILLGEAPNGSESVRRARWSVLVRDGDACDRVGDRPVFRLREPASVAPSTETGGYTTDGFASSTRSWVAPGLFVGAILAVVVLALSVVLRRRSF